MSSSPTTSAGFPSWYVHQSLEDGATPARLVHFAKHRLGCDRVSLLIPKGRSWRVLEVSGVAKVHRHSTTIRAIEQSALVLLKRCKQFIHPSQVELSQLESDAIDRLLDATDASQFALLPLAPSSLDSEAFNFESQHQRTRKKRDECIGALLCEQFSGADLFTGQQTALSEITAHGTIALTSWRYMRSVPGLKVLRLLGKLVSPLYRWKLLALVVLLATLVIGASYLETEHWVDASGELQPTTSRNIFAPASAIVSEVLVEHGQRVSEGELLLKLHSSQLQQLERQLVGEIRTSQQRLIAIKSQRISGAANVGAPPSTPTAGSYDPQMTELLQLEEKVENLKSQLKLTEAELGRLEIRAPISGQIATWDLERRLSERPVQSGDWLLTINDTSTDQWKLELKIPQPLISAVANPTASDLQAATEETHSEATTRRGQIQFRIGSMPEKTFHAKLTRLSTATQVDEQLGNVVVAQAAVESPLASWDLQAGSSVRAQIACGRKSLLAAYGYELKQWWYFNVDFRLRSYLRSIAQFKEVQ